ncbi:MAG TPA: hypothetical protein VNH46_11020 [Gemmatimonadales bacterium]|nr:hypothetical protein [Gemmatimonadales bacterium]
MVHYKDDSACFDPVPVDSLPGPVLSLAVDSVQTPGTVAKDYPAVGRWDLDSTTGRQFIGLKCGAAWCEVSSEKDDHRSRNYRARVDNDPTQPVLRIKGWYDEQRLGIIPTGGGRLVPSQVYGTVVPDPRLGDYDETTFGTSNWVPVGWVGIDHSSAKYEAKFALVPAPLPPQGTIDKMTLVSLCRDGSDPRQRCDFSGGTAPEECASSDGGTWYFRFQQGTRDLFKCATRVDHSNLGVKIPGTARWVWSDQDEQALWFRCEDGCCTSQ